MNNKTYWTRYQQGVCVKCGKHPPEVGKRCASCAERERQYQHEYYVQTHIDKRHKHGMEPYIYSVQMHGNEIFRGSRLEIADYFKVCSNAVQNWILRGKFYHIFTIQREA